MHIFMNYAEKAFICINIYIYIYIIVVNDGNFEIVKTVDFYHSSKLFFI